MASDTDSEAKDRLRKKENSKRFKQNHTQRPRAARRLVDLKKTIRRLHVKEHREAVPKIMPEPQVPGIVSNFDISNVYYVLEENCDRYVGRQIRRYPVEEAVGLGHELGQQNVRTSEDQWELFLDYQSGLVSDLNGLRSWEAHVRVQTEKLEQWKRWELNMQEVTRQALELYAERFGCTYEDDYNARS